MVESWLGTSWTQVGLVAVSTLGVFAAVIVYTRIVGLRSFSKMSSFDFAMTVAVGSVMATTAVTSSATLLNAIVGLGMLYAIQVVIALTRVRFGGERFVDNTPLLLMEGARLLHANLRRARVTEDDVRAKLREANVTDPGQILAVVLETTGDISVLHGDGPLDDSLLRGVRD